MQRLIASALLVLVSACGGDDFSTAAAGGSAGAGGGAVSGGSGGLAGAATGGSGGSGLGGAAAAAASGGTAGVAPEATWCEEQEGFVFCEDFDGPTSEMTVLEAGGGATKLSTDSPHSAPNSFLGTIPSATTPGNVRAEASRVENLGGQTLSFSFALAPSTESIPTGGWLQFARLQYAGTQELRLLYGLGWRLEHRKDATPSSAPIVTNAIATDAWNEISIVIDKTGKIALWVNSNLVGSQQGAAAAAMGAVTLWVGAASAVSPTLGASGQFDNVLLSTE
ncbi:MAG: hypothetical protein KF718_20265 [Polyangiaceae bacterium]|nr:hypothetical protein [Polyangiaceae bacterium]